jgi:hypothetical protein
MPQGGFDILVKIDHMRDRENGGRAAIYTTGMQHSPTSATGTGWERTPWQAAARGAGDATTG